MDEKTTLYYLGEGLARHDGRPLSRGDSIEVYPSEVDGYTATGLFSLEAPAAPEEESE